MGRPVRLGDQHAGRAPGDVEHAVLPDGDSTTQREAEAEILRGIGEQLGITLAPRRLNLSGGTYVDVDGANADLTVFAEVFAHVGPMKGGQKRKVALDVLKLITVQRMYPGATLIVALCDHAAMASLTGWLGEAISVWNVERRLAPLEPGLHRRLIEAQTRQYR